MKAFVAIFSGLMLLVGQLVAAMPATDCSNPAAKHCCGCGGKMPCCSQNASSDNPSPAGAVRTAPQNEISFAPPAFSLPAPPVAQPSSVHSRVAWIRTASLPLYTRDCALLM